MIACFDVHYADDATVRAAAIVFQNWSDETPIEQLVVPCSSPHEYVAGEFFKRELDPLKTVISKIENPIQTFLIDAYCQLSADGMAGLGTYLFNELREDSIVIGVAKNRFRDTGHAAEVFRGGSSRPLFVTSIGIDYQLAAGRISSMCGSHRIPTLLKMVDQLSRNG